MTHPPHPAPPPGEPHRPPTVPGHQLSPLGRQPPGPVQPYEQQPHGQQAFGQQAHGQGPFGQAGHGGYGAVPGPHLAPVAYKDATAAYLLWFFLGGLGAHKFYLRSPGLGALYLVLSLVGWATAWLLVGFLLLVPLAVLLVVDAFTMPERVRVVNASTHAINARFR